MSRLSLSYTSMATNADQRKWRQIRSFRGVFCSITCLVSYSVAISWLNLLLSLRVATFLLLFILCRCIVHHTRLPLWKVWSGQTQLVLSHDTKADQASSNTSSNSCICHVLIKLNIRCWRGKFRCSGLGMLHGPPNFGSGLWQRHVTGVSRSQVNWPSSSRSSSGSFTWASTSVCPQGTSSGPWASSSPRSPVTTSRIRRNSWHSWWMVYMRTSIRWAGSLGRTQLSPRSRRSQSMRWTVFTGAILYWWQMGDWGLVTKLRSGERGWGLTASTETASYAGYTQRCLHQYGEGWGDCHMKRSGMLVAPLRPSKSRVLVPLNIKQ